MDDDVLNLSRFVQAGDGEAFRSLVDRYINIVFAAARRQTSDTHLAEDVTQAVFVLLAQKARSIPQNRPLSAWLLKATSHCAANARRARDRRVALEKRVAAMSDRSHLATVDSGNHWQSIAPILDEGLGRLRSGDRDLLLLRFFEGCSISQIASKLQISEDAATKRISRAIHQLREFFQRRGIAVSAVVLTTLLTACSSEAAPATLAPSVYAATSNTTLQSTLISKGTLLMATSGQIKIATAAALAALLLAGGAVIQLKRGSNSEVVAAAPNPTTMPATTAPSDSLAMTFAGNVEVKLLGVQDERPADPSVWWAPNGMPVAAPKGIGLGRRSIGGSGTRNIRFIFRMTGDNVADKSLQVLTIPTYSDSTSGSTSPGSYTREAAIAFPQDQKTIDFRIGVAAGNWTDEITVDVPSGQTSAAPDSGVRMSDIIEQDGMTVVTIYYLPLRDSIRDERVVLITRDGKELQPPRVSRTGISTTYRFNVEKAAVSQAIYRRRDFEWATLKNVSLERTEIPTNVQIVPPAKPQP